MSNVPSGWRAAAEHVWDQTAIKDLLEAIRAAAVDGEPILDDDGQLVGRKPDVAAMRLMVEYAVGKPRKRAVVGQSTFDASLLGTVEGCREFAIVVAQAESCGDIDPEHADSLRKTVDLALRTHHAEQSSRVADSLEDMAADFMLLEAGRERESLDEIMTARSAKEASDGNES